MLIVVALGGNALLQRGQPLEAEIQRFNISIAAKSIAGLIERGHRVVITHGNGPQVGLLALQSEAYSEVSPYPFDVLNAESQSMIGYMLQQAIKNILPEISIVTLVTQTLVNVDDPAFSNPTKFIGPFYSQREAELLQKTQQWVLKKEGKQFRRVIASPSPQSIIELSSIHKLVNQGEVVICCGGGGVPVIQNGRQLRGIEAVVDKDLTSALLAIMLHADRLVILTDVAGIFLEWHKPNTRCIQKISYHLLEKMSFADGTMQPKVQAVCDFVKKTGNPAAIGSLQSLEDIIDDQSGTQITASDEEINFFEVGYGS